MPRRLQNERQQSGLLIVCLLGLSLSPAPPAAGFLVSESLLGSCFGIDRTASSCNLVVPRSLQTEDQFIFYTHDGRSIPISSWDEQLMAESAARATTFTFYTHDGRAVTAVDHVSDRQKQQPWNANHADAWSGTGYKDTSDPGLSVLRSRYPSQTRTQVQVRPAVPSVSRTNFAYSTLPYASGVKQLQHALSQPSSPADQPLGIQMPETNSSITLRLRGGSTRKGSVSKPPGVHNASAAAAASASAYEGPAPAETRSPGGPGVSEFAEAGAALSSKDGSLEGRLVNSAGKWRAGMAGMNPTPPIVGARKLMRVSTRALDGGAPMRIALLTWESLHTIAVGGVSPHVTELAAGLERRGHEVHVYSRTGDGQMPYEIIDGVHIHRVPIALDPDFITECGNMCNSFCWFLSESEAFQGAKFDICHGHDWLAAKALVQCKNMGRNTVATFHSTEFGRCGNVNYGGQSERIRRIEEEVVVVADRVISVSGVLCDEVKEQLRVSQDKLRMVHNGIHLAPYLTNVDAGSIKAKYNMGPLDPLVLFVGRLATQKGPDLLVEAVPMVLATRSDVKFVFVGDGYMRGDLERRVQELGVESAVRFLGSMSGLPLVQLFKSADCVCVPSRNEPFGIVVLEAWASGKPVVATISGGPREFVDHGVDGFHVHPSPHSISWGICEICSNFEDARQMGLRGRIKAQNEFNWVRPCM
eukprot:Tamp_05493.p1 GENE.Tamp_05493~~Tamp_05493.p1  ORF type:complete len:700 (+),score=90.02 Tamp_05493:299-2398(+)